MIKKLLWLAIIFGVFFTGSLTSYLYLNKLSLSDKVRRETLDKNLLWNNVQEWRAKSGYSPYQRSEVLCDFAKSRLPELYFNFEHDGFDSKVQRLGDHVRFTKVAENLAKDTYSPENTLKMWLESPTHLKDLQYDYRYSCIETLGPYTIQIFANF